jgi:hypothetical protein
MYLSELTIITTRSGGYEESAELLDIDADLIERAITGKSLSRLEKLEIDQAVAGYISNLDNPNDANDLLSTAGTLTASEAFISDNDNSILLRTALVEGLIEQSDLEQGYSLFANLSQGQQGNIFGILQDGIDGGHKEKESAIKDLREMFDGYYADDMDINGDVNESAFWEWFREVFYPE